MCAFALALAATLGQTSSFALQNGDRVVFYGDSITDNSAYCRQVELFTLTRFPNLNVRFYNAGVGGDRVTGGWMGPIDQRLTRDLFSRRPTVVTFMLGMNDASYSPFTQSIFDVYEKGYRHIVDRLHREDPKAHIWMFRPSPYDDVTRAPGFGKDGYNSVLIRYADFVSDMAKQNGYGVVDENGPLVDALGKANAMDPANAQKIIPDRVHPGWQGDFLMSEQVLKAWGAPSLVSSVVIDRGSGKAVATNASLRDVNMTGGLSWTEQENALPFPIPRDDGLMKLVLSSADLDKALNNETLTVTGLDAGSYKLEIDGRVIATLSSDQLAQGVNLAPLDTPMLRQAGEVRDLTEKRNAIWYQKWRELDFTLQDDPSPKLEAAKKALDALDDELVAEQHRLAQPKPHKFQLAPG